MSTTTTEHPANALSDADGVAVTELWYIFRRQFRSILLIVAIGTALAILLGLAQPQRYTATTLIMVQPRDNQIVSLNSGVESLPIDSATLETHTKLLQSRELALRVIDELQLTTNPEFRPPEAGSGWLLEALKAAFAPVASAAKDLAPTVTYPLPLARSSVDHATLPSDQDIEGMQLAEPNDPALPGIVLSFQHSLDASVAGKSYVIAISFSAGSPTSAAQIANAAASQYLKMLREQTRSAASDATGTFTERLEELRDAAQEALSKVANFKADNNIVTVAEGVVEVNDQRLMELNNQLIKATTEGQEKAARLSRVSELRNQDGSVDAVAAVVDSELIERIRHQQVELAQLESEARKTYGINHPQMIALREQRDDLSSKFRGEVERIIDNLRYEVDVARRQEASIREAIDQVTATKSAIAKVSSQLSSLQQEADAARNMYETFLQQTEETKQQAILGEPQARIASRAAPPDAPDRLSLKFFGLVGLVASTFGASLIAVFRDRMRGTVRRGRDLKDHADLHCLGLIPRLDPAGFYRDAPVSAATGNRSAFTESLRSVVIAIQREGPGRPGRTLAVTSSLPQEGKSFIAASLAITLGRLGHRTLLIDLDLRRPKIGRLFNRSSSAGVFEIMRGEREASTCILRDVSEGVDLLPARAMPADPVAVLAAPSLQAMLKNISRNYHWVIIDSPPTLGLTDARLVGQLAGMVMFVTRWDSTPTSALKVAVGDLRSFGVNLIGGIVNDVDLRLHQTLGYGIEDREGYYSKYKSYYVKI